MRHTCPFFTDFPVCRALTDELLRVDSEIARIEKELLSYQERRKHVQTLLRTAKSSRSDHGLTIIPGKIIPEFHAPPSKIHLHAVQKMKEERRAK